MTMMSQYLQAERPDNTEPASFYLPGATDWSQAGMRRRRGQVSEDDAGEVVAGVEELEVEQ